MAYNKAKAEREWLRWKEAEEKKLRELGVDEETAREDACKVEHDLSEVTYEAIKAHALRGMGK